MNKSCLRLVHINYSESVIFCLIWFVIKSPTHPAFFPTHPAFLPWFFFLEERQAVTGATPDNLSSLGWTCGWAGWRLEGERKSFRAYSFCAVFLFRFINRNRNRRVQKERFSFERNNFHGNKMAQCLISNWKGKKYENIIRERNSKKKYGRLSWQTSVFADRVIFSVLSCQSSNLYSWLPAGNGELLLCWQPSLSKGKAVRKMRNKRRKSLLCFPWLRRYFDEGERAEDYFPGYSRRQGKKRKRRCLQHKKRSRPTCL